MQNFEENFHLFNYLKNIYFSKNELFEYIRYELDNKIYYEGSYFREHPVAKSFSFANIKEYILLFYSFYTKFQAKRKQFPDKVILSSSYINLNSQINELKYLVLSPPWQVSKYMLSNWNLFKQTRDIKFSFRDLNFNELNKEQFQTKIFEIKLLIKEYFFNQNIAALILPHDMGFFEKLSVDICKELDITTFNYTHGTLHQFYNLIDDNRTDYLIVWGKKSKEAFEKMGWGKSKVFVAGNPKYQKLPQKLEFGNSNILVITKGMNGGQFSDRIRLTDKGNCILYLYSVQHVLQQLGIKKARFRPHPSESIIWYQKFLDNDFYKPDTDFLKDSLEQASLVIGPISTLFVESLYYEKNYVIYEPVNNGMNMLNSEMTPPIDGSDERIPLATSEEELLYILKNRIKVELEVFGDYIKVPFDISFIKDLIK